MFRFYFFLLKTKICISWVHIGRGLLKCLWSMLACVTKMLVDWLMVVVYWPSIFGATDIPMAPEPYFNEFLIKSYFMIPGTAMTWTCCCNNFREVFRYFLKIPSIEWRAKSTIISYTAKSSLYKSATVRTVSIVLLLSIYAGIVHFVCSALLLHQLHMRFAVVHHNVRRMDTRHFCCYSFPTYAIIKVVSAVRATYSHKRVTCAIQFITDPNYGMT